MIRRLLALSLLVAREKELPQPVEQHRLAVVLRYAEGRGHHANQVVGPQPGADQLAEHEVVGRQPLGERGRQHRLACADLARDDDEPFALARAVYQVGDRPPVAAAGKEESRIRTEQERPRLKTVEGFVHAA